MENLEEIRCFRDCLDGWQLKKILMEKHLNFEQNKLEIFSNFLEDLKVKLCTQDDNAVPATRPL